jgi:4'-phosphopantetheinyl transferase
VSAVGNPWRRGPQNPVLQTGEVHVWWARLDQVSRRLTTRALSPEEQDRAEQILPSGRRLRWASSRALLRALLGRYLGVEPGRVELEAGPQRKPALPPDVDPKDGRAPASLAAVPDIGFSLSHSRDRAVFAIARGRRVGVDLELLRAVPHAVSLARRAFGAERAHELANLRGAQRDAAFLRMWTRHEAQLKCVGTGLLAADGSSQATWTLELPSGGLSAAALALDAAPRGLSFWRWCPEPTECRSEDPDGDCLRERRAFVDNRQEHASTVKLA